jgi:hypothetical protein
MRKLFAAPAALGLALAAATAAAQILPPAAPLGALPGPPVAASGPAAPGPATAVPAAHHARHEPAGVASDGSAEEGQAIEALRVLLRERGFGPDVTAGSMTALPPGSAVYGAWPTPDDELEALVGPYQPQAWLVRTDAGRWWVWASDAAAPADLRAETYQRLASLRARDEGRVLD